MRLFKPSTGTVSNKFVARLEGVIWILIYGGLLALVLGLFVGPAEGDTGWCLVVGGGLTAVAGGGLIYVRSRIKDDA